MIFVINVKAMSNYNMKNKDVLFLNSSVSDITNEEGNTTKNNYLLVLSGPIVMGIVLVIYLKKSKRI